MSYIPVIGRRRDDEVQLLGVTWESEKEIQIAIEESIRLSKAQLDLDFGPGFEPNTTYDDDGKAWVPIEQMVPCYNT